MCALIKCKINITVPYKREGEIATPKNLRTQVFSLNHGGAEHTYNNDEIILPQIRKSMPVEEDIQPSFKVAVNLTPLEALAFVTELLLAVPRHPKDSPKLDKSHPSGVRQCPQN